MTCDALGIVGRRASRDLLMWIVARDAADSAIAAIVALAVREPIRLEPYVARSVEAIADDSFPSPVALAAEIRDFLR